MSNHSEKVIYITPFDRRREMPRWMAENFRSQDNERYARLEELDTLTFSQRTTGPPRIEGARKQLIDNEGLSLTEGNDFA